MLSILKIFLVAFCLSALLACSTDSYTNHYASDVLVNGNSLKLLVFSEYRKSKQNYLNSHSGRTWTEKSEGFVITYDLNFDDLELNASLTPRSINKHVHIEGGIDSRNLNLSGSGVFIGDVVKGHNRKFVLNENKVINTSNEQVVSDLTNNTHYQEFIEISESNYYEAYKQGHADTRAEYNITRDGNFIASFAATYLVPETNYFDFTKVNVFDVRDSNVSSFYINTDRDGINGLTILEVEYFNDQWNCLVQYNDNGQSFITTWTESAGFDTDYSFVKPENLSHYDGWNPEQNILIQLPIFASPNYQGQIGLELFNYKTGQTYELLLSYDIPQ